MLHSSIIGRKSPSDREQFLLERRNRGRVVYEREYKAKKTTSNAVILLFTWFRSFTFISDCSVFIYFLYIHSLLPLRHLLF
jgi:hypothetical protein